MADFVGAVDQGTTSTRFMIFDHAGREVGKHQLEHEQILPRAGWVEHNPIEIWERTQTVIGTALGQAGLAASDLAAIFASGGDFTPLAGTLTQGGVDYPFSTGSNFEGIISGDGRWKLHLPHAYRTLVTPGHDGAAGKYRQDKIGLALFDLSKDPYETRNLVDEQPEVTARLKVLAEEHQVRFYSKVE